MDEQLEEIAASLLGQRLPNDWRKFAPDTCMALAEWLDHLQVLELNRTNVCLCLHGPLFWGVWVTPMYFTFALYFRFCWILCASYIHECVRNIRPIAPVTTIQTLVGVRWAECCVVLWFTCSQKLHQGYYPSNVYKHITENQINTHTHTNAGARLLSIWVLPF